MVYILLKKGANPKDLAPNDVTSYSLLMKNFKVISLISWVFFGWFCSFFIPVVGIERGVFQAPSSHSFSLIDRQWSEYAVWGWEHVFTHLHSLWCSATGEAYQIIERGEKKLNERFNFNESEATWWKLRQKKIWLIFNFFSLVLSGRTSIGHGRRSGYCEFQREKTFWYAFWLLPIFLSQRE